MKRDPIIDTDITEAEFESIHIPMQDNLERFMDKFVVAEVVAFSIADAYNRGGLCDSSFETHYRSMGDVLLVKPPAVEVVDQVKEILEIKYGLVIVEVDPVRLERVKGCDHNF